MQRDLSRLADTTFDVLIVGAGIYGAAIAWDAAQRGLSVALVDRGDFGGSTSFNNAKTLHGGVRSLQGGRLGELREYVRERRAIMRIVPHLVRPLPFLVPTTRSLTRNRLTFGLYFHLYDLLSHDRNAGLDPAVHLGGSAIVSRDACLEANPVADAAAVTGGVRWSDGQMHSGERVTLAFVKAAAAAGAAVANYVALDRWLTAGEAVVGARVQDLLGGGSIEVRARLSINAAGPQAGRLLQSLFARTPPIVPALSLAMNVVTRRVTRETAIGGMARGRLFFLAPWRQWTIAGTSHDPFHDPSGEAQATGADVERLLGDVNEAFPGAALTAADVRLVHRGLLPALRVDGGQVRLLKSSVVRDHRPDGRPGLISVVGVRYTTARHTAEQVTDLACRMLDKPAAACRTAVTPLPGGDIPDLASFLSAPARGPGVPNGQMVRLAHLYGTERADVLAHAARDPSLAATLAPGCDTLGAEIVHAVREEMAVHLSDVLLRRTEAGSAGHPGRPAIERAAALMAAELGWSRERTAQEVHDVDAVYGEGSGVVPRSS